MKLVLALTALIVMAQAHLEENRMGPVEAMEMTALMKAATIKFCKDVANGNDEAAWAHANQALAFQCGPKGTQALCDEMTADKDLGLAAIAGKLNCNEENRVSQVLLDLLDPKNRVDPYENTAWGPWGPF